MNKLGTSFYAEENVVAVAKDLLGKVIFSDINGLLTGGVITETEAYAGIADRASHAFGNRRTNRTETIYRGGGLAYIYLCYGIHHLFNFVTAGPGIPHAVLLRGIYPVIGRENMLNRIKVKNQKKYTFDGPGKTSKALGITTQDNGVDLTGNRIWVESWEIEISKNNILTTTRIGVDYAGEDARLPYRFVVKQPERMIINKKTS